MKAGRQSGRWTVLFVVGACLALTPTLATAESRNVALKNNKFIPGRVNVAPGDTVVWANEDSTSHSVTFDDGSFDSHRNCVQPPIGSPVNCMNPGETAERTFSQPGEFGYRCKVHPQMTGVVVVAAEVTTTTTTEPTTTTEAPTTVTTAATTTTTRKLATSSTLASTTTTTVPAETTTTLTPSESPSFDPEDPDDQTGTAAPGGGGGGSGSGTVALIVAVLLAVAGGGGLLLWRLRPRSVQP